MEATSWQAARASERGENREDGRASERAGRPTDRSAAPQPADVTRGGRTDLTDGRSKGLDANGNGSPRGSGQKSDFVVDWIYRIGAKGPRVRAIWKYRLPIKTGEQELGIPPDGRVVHVGMQAGQIAMWVEVDPSEGEGPRIFRVAATGEGVDDLWKYVGTVLDDPYVWHVFEWTG